MVISFICFKKPNFKNFKSFGLIYLNFYVVYLNYFIAMIQCAYDYLKISFWLYSDLNKD